MSVNWVKMKLLVLLFLCCCGSTVRHSLKNFYMASSGVPNFPEFVVVGILDDIQIERYDSDTKKKVPKQEWMKKITELDPQYWDRYSHLQRVEQKQFKSHIEILKQHFNQTGGVHLLQYLSGCEWENETRELDGFSQYGYDGEDFISLDLKTWTWVPASQQAIITKLKLDKNEYDIAKRKHYLTTLCPDLLEKFLKLGRSSLLRTAPPSVSLLQKTPSSPVTCHATGFYPARAALMWTKDGEELHEEVECGEILPNQDGTFQTSAELQLESSAQAEDWTKYQCVFQLRGLKDDVVTRLDKDKILSNRGWRPPGGEANVSLDQTTIICSVALGVLALALVFGLSLAICRWKKAIKSPKGFLRRISGLLAFPSFAPSHPSVNSSRTDCSGREGSQTLTGGPSPKPRVHSTDALLPGD